MLKTLLRGSPVILVLALAACGYDDDDSDPIVGPSGDTDTVQFEELEMEVPEDWDSDTVAEDSVLRVANFELQSDEAVDPVTEMTQEDVLLLLADSLPNCDPATAPRGLPVAVQQLDLVTDQPEIPRGHATACYAFILEGEFLEDGPTYELLVEFGSESPAPRLIDEVNDVLGTLQQAD
jgi:hypothetical protein